MTETSKEARRFEPFLTRYTKAVGMWEVNDGKWVRASDYDALAAKLAEVEAERDALKKLPDRSVYLANQRQALCIHLTAAALGPDYAATIEGLPKAARHVADSLASAEAERDAALAALEKNDE